MQIITEARNWILLLLGIIGAFVTIKTFLDNVRQRKLDNTFKTLEYLRKHIPQEYIDTFITLFHANGELRGVKYNEFRFPDGRTDTIENMFSEGGCGNGDIHNMIEVFNLISKSLNQNLLAEELIWYEYGQIMFTCYKWTKYLEENKRALLPYPQKGKMSDKDYKKFIKKWEKSVDAITMFYRDFNEYMAQTKVFDKPTKYYTYAE